MNFKVGDLVRLVNGHIRRVKRVIYWLGTIEVFGYIVTDRNNSEEAVFADEVSAI